MVNIKRMALLLAPTALGLAVLVWWSRKSSPKAEPEIPAPVSDMEALASDPEKRREFMRAMGKVGGKKGAKKAKQASPSAEEPPSA